MRTKSTKQQYFDFSGKSRLKVVNEYREKYRLISQLLDDNPQLVVGHIWGTYLGTYLGTPYILGHI